MSLVDMTDCPSSQKLPQVTSRRAGLVQVWLIRPSMLRPPDTPRDLKKRLVFTQPLDKPVLRLTKWSWSFKLCIPFSSRLSKGG